MILMLDGPKRSGKSTVGRLLSQKLGIPLYHFLLRDGHLIPHSEFIDYHERWDLQYALVDMIATVPMDFIWDRSIMSNLAFSMTVERFRYVEGAITTAMTYNDIRWVLFRASWEVTVARRVRDAEPNQYHSVPDSNVDEQYYRDEAERFGLVYRMIDYLPKHQVASSNDGSAEEVMCKIIQRLPINWLEKKDEQQTEG